MCVCVLILINNSAVDLNIFYIPTEDIICKITELFIRVGLTIARGNEEDYTE